MVNGLYTVVLNSGGEFGTNAFQGEARWLEMAVRVASSGGYNTLSLAILSRPYPTR